MDANEIKMKILESSGWTIKELNDASAALVKLDIMYTNDELAYRTIARELGIKIEEERDYQPKPESRSPTPLVTIQGAKDDLDDGEYFSTYFKVLAPFRAPKETVGFLPIADNTMQIDLKFWSDQFDKGEMFEAGKTYKIDGIQGSYSEKFGWGISFAKYTKFEEVDEEINPPITKIGVLEDNFKTFVVQGIVDEVKPTGIDLSYCEQCGKYAGTRRQLEDEGTDFFCSKCQEVTEVVDARPISGRVMDDSGSVSFGLPFNITESPMANGDRVSLAGNYSSKKDKLYAKSILNVTHISGVSVTLDSFLKKKKPKKRKTVAKTRKVELDKAVEHYEMNKEANWCSELKVPDDLMTQFSIYGIDTPDDAAALVSKLLTKGVAFMPEAGLLKAV